MRLLPLLLCVVLASCGGGGSNGKREGGTPAGGGGGNGGGGTQPPVYETYQGRWGVYSSRTISSTDPTLFNQWPGPHETFTFGPKLLERISGAPVDRASIESNIGFRLATYNNAGDGKGLVFGFAWAVIDHPNLVDTKIDRYEIGYDKKANAIVGLYTCMCKVWWDDPHWETYRSEFVLARIGSGVDTEQMGRNFVENTQSPKELAR